MERTPAKARPSLFSILILASLCSFSLAGWIDMRPEIGSAYGMVHYLVDPSQESASTSSTATKHQGALEVLGQKGKTSATPVAERGEWREISFYSRTLERDMSYLAWLPPGYDPSKQAIYPTLYLLHGAGDGENVNRMEWRNLGIDTVLADLISRGEAKPMIVILPEGEQGYWINHAPDGPRWSDYLVQDVVTHVDLTFPTDARPERRALGGLSMGGHGAAQIALNHPQVFRIAGMHSPSLRPYEESPEFFGDREWFARFDPLSLARNSSAVKRVNMWIDSGSRDRWRQSAEHLSNTLQSRKAPIQFHVLDGGHDGEYWRTHLPLYLHFYSEQLSK